MNYSLRESVPRKSSIRSPACPASTHSPERPDRSGRDLHPRLDRQSNGRMLRFLRKPIGRVSRPHRQTVRRRLVLGRVLFRPGALGRHDEPARHPGADAAHRNRRGQGRVHFQTGARARQHRRTGERSRCLPNSIPPLAIHWGTVRCAGTPPVSTAEGASPSVPAPSGGRVPSRPAVVAKISKSMKICGETDPGPIRAGQRANRGTRVPPS